MKLRACVLPIAIASIFLLSGCYQTNQSIDSLDNSELKESIETSSKDRISEKDAVNLVKKYLSDNGYHMSSHIEVDSIDGENYLVHAYDIINNEDESHTATTGWFEVNMYTGQIKDIMN